MAYENRHANIRSLVRNLDPVINNLKRDGDPRTEASRNVEISRLQAIRARALDTSDSLENEPMRVALAELAREAGIEWQPLAN